jgi:predicted metal-binding protein
MKKNLLILALLVCACSYAQLTVSTTSVQNVLCYGGANGSAVATVSGGNGIYTYTWMPGGTHASFVNGLSAGSYTVLVKDGLGATGSAVLNITQPATALSATSTQTNAVCNNNGILQIIASGGTPPYLYNTGSYTTDYITGLAGGNYTYQVRDANNCMVTNSVTISFTSPIYLSIATTSLNCANTCNGSATVTATGGQAPYTYTWTGTGITTAVASGLCGGKKTVKVTDANGCIQTQTTMVAHLPFTASVSFTNVSCNASCDGALGVNVSGGGGPSYSYVWSPGGITTPTVANACVGTYSVLITDSKGCQLSQSVPITMTGSVSASFSGTNTSCFGVCDGAVQVNVSGGGGGSYSISSIPAGISAMNNTNLCAGIYTITVASPRACSFVSTYTVSEPAPLAIVMSTANATCGDCNGNMAAGVSGGTSPYYYASSLGTTTQSITNLCPGTYSMTVTDSKGCSMQSVTTITNTGTALSGITATLTPSSESCYLSSDGSIDLTVGGLGSTPLTYSWNNGATSQDLASVPSGTYCVNISNPNGACANFCTSVVATGTNCGSISGNIFIDTNTDCVKNGSEVNFPNILMVVNPGNRLGYTDPSGNYTISNLPFGTYSISIATPSVIMTCASTITTSVSSGSPVSTNNNLGISSAAQPDLQVTIFSNGVVPGFGSYVTYQVKNQNNVSTGGNVKARLAAPFIAAITSANPSGYTLSGDTLIWNFTSTPYPGNSSFTVYFTAPVTTSLGSTFTTCATATAYIPDLNLTNNSHCYSTIVTGSFDPNDKSVSPVGMGTEGNITLNEKELNYLIRFQNTGNGPAVNVVVKDTLSPFLDIMSLDILSVSHAYQIEILSGNVLRWKFENIMLPDSNSNEPGSHGYIQYRIKQKTNNALGSEIKNTAYIYFDFNEPVITNTTLNTLWAPTVGLEALSNSDGNWLLYPNPATHVLYVKNALAITEGTTQLELMNAMGQVLHTESFTGISKSIDLSAYAGGVYFVRLVTDKQSTIKRVVISR